MERKLAQFKYIPLQDTLAFMLNVAIKTTNDHSKMTRRTIICYVEYSTHLTISTKPSMIW